MKQCITEYSIKILLIREHVYYSLTQNSPMCESQNSIIETFMFGFHLALHMYFYFINLKTSYLCLRSLLHCLYCVNNNEC